MRSRFDMGLEDLKKEMVTMDMLCETAIARAGKALLTNDADLAKQAMEGMDQIYHKEREIESICIKLLLQQQPVAKDLRVISAALKMVTDVKRIGEQAADIAEIVLAGNIKTIPPELPLKKMVHAAIKMVTDSINSFVGSDEKLALSVLEYDDIVDEYFLDCKKSIIHLLKSEEADGEAITDLLIVAKYLEKIGDHAVNIARWELFTINGEIVDKDYRRRE
jgi:phosphate transport system protein